MEISNKPQVKSLDVFKNFNAEISHIIYWKRFIYGIHFPLYCSMLSPQDRSQAEAFPKVFAQHRSIGLDDEVVYYSLNGKSRWLLSLHNLKSRSGNCYFTITCFSIHTKVPSAGVVLQVFFFFFFFFRNILHFDPWSHHIQNPNIPSWPNAIIVSPVMADIIPVSPIRFASPEKKQLRHPETMLRVYFGSSVK